MAIFTVRVEMHGATSKDYDLLHERMAAKGFKRFLEGQDDSGGNGLYELPTGEYDYTAEVTARDVRELVKGIAGSVKPGAWVLITEIKNRVWHTRKVRSL